MREILFRGKRPNGQWVQGDLTQFHIDEEVISKIGFHTTRATLNGLETVTYTNEVIPETVGQYTGLNIGNEKLFEGDIVEWHEDYDDKWGYSQTTVGRSVVIWDKENFCWAFETNAEYIQPFNDWNWNSGYIIGNIHDNPELLKESDNNE